MENMKKLIAKLKIIEDNLKILHHNLVGPNWLSDHELLASYYEKIEEIEDAVIEMNIMLGGQDLRVADCITEYKNIDVREYSNREAFSICLKFFMELVESIEAVKPEIPGDCVSELETFQYWLRLEGRYKLAHRLAIE